MLLYSCQIGSLSLLLLALVGVSPLIRDEGLSVSSEFLLVWQTMELSAILTIASSTKHHFFLEALHCGM